jgi:hypothetical protein
MQSQKFHSSIENRRSTYPAFERDVLWIST